MPPGNRRIVQDDFSAGAFPGTSFENIPRNGLVDATGMLVDDDRSLKMRGGSRWAAPAMGVGATVRWMWSGVIGSTKRTIVANGAGSKASDDLAVTTVATGAGAIGDAPGVSLAGKLFLPGGQTLDSALVLGAAPLARDFYAVAGNRLWMANRNSSRVDFSDIGTPATVGATSFHEIPEGGILGLIGLRDAVVVFTTSGVWIISNVGLNLTDTAGNVQHRIDRYSRDLVLWHSNGLGAGFEGALVVPARDGVYLLNYGVASEAPQQFTLISRPIANLYRSYVAAGYMPGQPTVHRGTLLLPIRTVGEAFVDLLVCRLDMTDSRGRPSFPWTRFGYLAGTAPATPPVPVTLATSVFTGNLIGGGQADDRLMTLDYFDSSLSATDADASVPRAFVFTRSPISSADVATLVKVRMGYEYALADPIAGAYYDREGGIVSFPDTAGANSTDLQPHTWRVGQRARLSAIGVQVDRAPFILRSMEWFLRDRGRV
jgi:hypothetical protein